MKKKANSKSSTAALVITGVASGVLGGYLYFNRNPDRTIKPAPGKLLATADGTIEKIADRKIHIYIGLLDVHVQRIPADGVVTNIQNKDDYYDWITVKTASGEITFGRAGGVLARSLETYIKPGDSVRQGQVYGRILLGSHAYMNVPDNFIINVKNGDTVKAGQSIIATIK